MTNHATLLRQIRAEARPYIEQWLEIGEVFAGFRKLAADNDLDWGVIKALIKAEVQDEQDEGGGSKRVTKIIDKADCASAYADMLGLGGGEEKINFSSEPDKDGVIIEPASAPSDAEAGQEGDRSASSVALASEEGADAIVFDAPSSQINPEAKATEVEPGNAGGIEVPVRLNNDREGVASRLAGGRTPAGEGAEPSGDDAPSHVSEHDAQRDATVKPTSPAPVATRPASSQEPCSHGSGAVQDRCESTAPTLSPSGDIGATETDGGSHEVASTASKSSDNRQVFDEPSGADPGSTAESGAQVSSSVAAIPFPATDAPVEQSPSHDNAPGATHSGEWPELPARFDRRRISEAAA